jgi:hypothetical protein
MVEQISMSDTLTERLASEIATALLANDDFLKSIKPAPVQVIQQAAPEPFAVNIPEAARLLGRGRKPGGGRSSINEDIARGLLDAVKDGSRTLVTMESIRRLHASRPRAVFSPLPPRLPASEQVRRKRRKAKREGG